MAEKWVAILNIPELPLGTQRFWLRATDEVGNQTETSYPVELLSPPQATDSGVAASATPNNAGEKKPVKSLTTSVSGQLMYGTRAVQDGVVTLVGNGYSANAKADANGRFQFQNVPAGAFRLTARGVSGGNSVKTPSDVSVNVLPPEKGPTQLGSVRVR